MPIWIYLYLTVILFGSILAIVANKNKSSYYVPGEILAVIFCILIFLIKYKIINFQYSVPITIFATLFFLYWHFWENRHFYSFKGIESELSNEEDIDEYEPEDTTTTYSALLALFITLYLLPVFYAIWGIISE